MPPQKEESTTAKHYRGVEIIVPQSSAACPASNQTCVRGPAAIRGPATNRRDALKAPPLGRRTSLAIADVPGTPPSLPCQLAGAAAMNAVDRQRGFAATSCVNGPFFFAAFDRNNPPRCFRAVVHVAAFVRIHVAHLRSPFLFGRRLRPDRERTPSDDSFFDQHQFTNRSVLANARSRSRRKAARLRTFTCGIARRVAYQRREQAVQSAQIP